MNKFVLRQSLILLLTAIVWGVAFVAQSVGMDYVEPFTFLAARSFIGAVVLLPYILFRDRHTEKQEGNRKVLLAGGICCGVMLFIASSLQQFGIVHTTVGKAGFITAMYIVLVPVIGIFLKKKAGIKIWCGVAIAVAGLYLLCMTPGQPGFQKGDVLVLLGAAAFSFHILVVDYFAPRGDGVKLSFIQFVTCAVLAAVGMIFFETPSAERLLEAWIPILYAGALSSGVGYTMQIVGQRGMNPTVASLIMSLESVISVIAGWAILGEALSIRELWGCILMFGAIVLVQLPEKGLFAKMRGVKKTDMLS